MEELNDLLKCLDALSKAMMGLNNYEERKVDRYETKELLISTAMVLDNEKFPFETAISHKKYNNGDLIIVEEYKTKEEAQIGHNKWVSIMTAKELPAELKDVATNDISKLSDKYEKKDWRTQTNTDIKDLEKGLDL